MAIVVEPTVEAPADPEPPAVVAHEGRPWVLAVRVVLAGLAGLFTAIGGIAAGAIITDWAERNVEAVRGHPVLVAVVTTVVCTTALFRAIPWARILGPDHVIADEPVGAAGEGGSVDSRTWRERVRAHVPAMATLAAVTVATTLVVHRNILSRFTTRSIGLPGDREWYMYLSWKIGEAISNGSSPFHLQGLVAPYGYDLLVGDGFLPPFVGGFLNLVMGPVAAYNTMLMLATAATVLAGAYLARRLTTVRWIQMVVAVAVATAPVVYARYEGHFALCFTFPIALAVAEAVDLSRGNRVRPVRTTLWLLLAFGCSIYYLIIAAGVVLAGAAARWWRVRDERRRTLLLVAGIFAATMIVIAPFIVQRIRFSNAELDGGSSFNASLETDGVAYNADVLSVALPTYPTLIDLPGTDKFYRNVTDGSGEGNFSFPGPLLLVVGVGGLVLWRRSLVPILVAGAVLWVLSLGPVADVYGVHAISDPSSAARIQWMPFKLIGELPLLSGLRAPGRLSLGLPAFLAVGLAVAFDGVRSRWGSGRRQRTSSTVALAAASCLLLFNIPTLHTSPQAIETDAAKSMLESLRHRDGRVGAVAVVPSCQPEIVGIDASLQIWHRLDSVGCEGPYLALPFASEMDTYRRSPDLAALRCRPDALGYVTTEFPLGFTQTSPEMSNMRTTLGVRYLLVDLAYMTTCPSVGAVVTDLASRYEVIPGDATWEAIDLDRPVR